MNMFGAFFQVVFLLIFIIFVGFYINFKLRTRYYWKKRNIPYAEPYFILGSCPDITFLKSATDCFKDLDKRFKDSKVYGVWLYTRTFLVVKDVEVAKTILVKEFKHFHDRGVSIDTKHEPLLGNLFFLNGSKWRNMRVKLAPTFTSGKMKMMFNVMLECSQSLQDYMLPFAESSATIDVKEPFASFATDIITSCAFGVETKTIGKPDSDIRKYSRLLIDLPFINIIGGILNTFVPQLAIALKLKQTPAATEKFFTELFHATVRYRQENNIRRNDFLQLLIELMDKGYVEDVDTKYDKDLAGETEKFTIQEATCQAFVFFMAGFESSATTMMFAFYELALNPEIQDKVADEISWVLKKHGDKLSYEAIQEMTYLDQVIQETLRLHPLLPVIFRICTETYQIPDTDVVIDKETPIFLSLHGIHHDPDLYPDPYKFDPDRFAPGHQNYTLSFGDGPRICIGNRFAMLQMKIGMATILKKFTFEVTKETPIPLKFVTRSFLPLLTTGMFLKIKLRGC